MAKRADRIREALKPRLEADEELRSVGVVTTHSLTFLILFGSFAKYWYVGITQKRVFFGRTGAFRINANTNIQFSTPLNNVKLDGTRFAVVTPVEAMPQNFRLAFRTKRATGFDLDEFKKALDRNLQEKYQPGVTGSVGSVTKDALSIIGLKHERVDCPNCGNRVLANAIKCNRCKMPLTTKQPAVAQPPVNNTITGTIPNAGTTPPAAQAKFCTGCGTRIEPEDSFCPGCGQTNQA